MKRSKRVVVWLLAAVAACTLLWNQGEVHTYASGRFGPTPITDVYRFPFAVSEAGVSLKYRIRIELSEGTVRARIVDPSGNVMVAASGGTFTLMGPETDRKYAPGKYSIEIQAQQAVGTWQVTVQDKNRSFFVDSSRLLTGKLMTLVGVLGIGIWRWRSHATWRYFFIGGAIWAVGVALKFGWALLLNAPIMGMLNNAFPPAFAFAASAIYIGLLTGVFEIGVTVAAVRFWPSWSIDATRGLAIGIGAGAAEAVALGLAVSLSAVFAPDIGATSASWAWLLPVTERTLALVCHASSRAVVLFSMATGKARWAWTGFAVLTAVDVVAGAFLLNKGPVALSPWYVELALAPLGLIGIFLLVVVIKRWPAP